MILGPEFFPIPFGYQKENATVPFGKQQERRTTFGLPQLWDRSELVDF